MLRKAKVPSLRRQIARERRSKRTKTSGILESSLGLSEHPRDPHYVDESWTIGRSAMGDCAFESRVTTHSTFLGHPGMKPAVRFAGWIQLINATRSLNISAGVWKPSVLRGLWFSCLAIALS